MRCMSVLAWTRPSRPAVGRAVLPDPFVLAYVLVSSLYLVGIAAGFGGLSGGSDLLGFYNARLPDPYPVIVYTASQQGFFYSPAVAQVLEIVRLVPWLVVAVAYSALLLATLYWIVGRRAILAVLLTPVASELNAGNIHLLLAVVAAAGARYPVLWAFPLLTKITPGIGLVWFAVRREWRPLAIAAGATLSIVAISFALAPGLWPEWIALLVANQGATLPFWAIPVSLAIRLPLALAVIVWGARTDRPWTVAVAMTLALPVLWVNGLCVLLGAARSRSQPLTPRQLTWLSAEPLLPNAFGHDVDRAGRG